MHGLLEQVLKSPRLIDWSDSIVRKLDDERSARAKFRTNLGESREEFIIGEVIAPVANQLKHALALQRVSMLITCLVRSKNLGVVVCEAALVEFPRNDYCPDLCFWPTEMNIEVDLSRLVFPPPRLAIEILSPSTESRDRGVKFEDYEAHGVKEYWIVDPDRRSIEQYVESNGQYEQTFVGQTGTVRSTVIAGFEMPVEAAFDDAVQMQALQGMLAR